MGTYYVAASHEKREFVDPARLGLCPKKWSCYAGDFAHLVCYLMLERWRWDGVELVGDDSDPYDGHTDYTGYADVTREAVIEFNEHMASQRPFVEPMFKVPEEGEMR